MGLLFGGLATIGAGVFLSFFLPVTNWVQSWHGSSTLLVFVVYMGGLGYMAITLVLLVGVVVGPGYGSATALEQQSRLVKCRSISAAATATTISTIISACLIWLIIAVALKVLAPFPIGTGILLLSFVVSLGASVWVAIKRSSISIRAAKFCEACESYMAESVVAHLDRDTAHKAMSKFAKAGSVFPASPDSPINVRRFQCEHGDEGYTELEVEFEARWPRNPNEQLPMGLDALQGRSKIEKMNKRWLAFSSAMKRSQFDSIRFTAQHASVLPVEVETTNETP